MNEATIKISTFDEVGDDVEIHWDPIHTKWVALREMPSGGTTKVPIPGRVMRQRLKDDVERNRADMEKRNKEKGKRK